MFEKTREVCVALALVGVAVPCLAGVPPSEVGGPSPAVAQLVGDQYDPARGAAAPEWGTSDFSMFQVGAAGFSVKSSSTTWDYLANGYIYRTGGPSDQFWYPVTLPAGARLDGVRVFYRDISASNITVYFTRYYGDTAPSYEDIVTWSSTGTPGYSSDYISINYTIDYKDAIGGNEQQFVLIVSLADASSNMAFKGVRLLYYLQVSPAPATATFADVPVGAFGFQHIEALAASGITGGCGGGNFCPNDPLTRAQMAVFLAKALGLHWNGNGH